MEQFAVLEAREHVYHDHQTFGIESEEIVVLGSLGICGWGNSGLRFVGNLRMKGRRREVLYIAVADREDKSWG